MLRYILLGASLLLAFSSGYAQRKASLSAIFGDLRARQIGPARMSGRITTLDVVNSQPTIMYVGAASGGVWKSTSAGSSFRPIFDDYTMSIGKIAIDQAHPDTVWVGTGECWTRNSVSVGTGIYQTTNGGSTWKQMGLDSTERIADIIIHPEDPNTLYVAALGHLWDDHEDRGVYRTTDGGQTWEKILYLNPHTGCADLAMDPSDPQILYASMWDMRRTPWFFDSGYEGTSGLYKSVDGGANWEPIHNGFPDEKLGRFAIAVAPSNPDVLYASVECESADKKGIYRSTDKGANWEFVNGDFNAKVRPFYFANIVVDPHNDSALFKCAFNLIYSKNRGKSFRTIGSGVHSDVHDVWIDPSNTKHVIIGTDGGIYESLDGAYTFKMFMNLPVSQFYHVSIDMETPYRVYGGLQDNGSWYAPNRKSGGVGNSDWMMTYGGDGFYTFRHPNDPDIVYCEAQGGAAVRYNEKTGQAKDIQPFPVDPDETYRYNWNTPIYLSPTNPERLYIGAQYLFVSEDRGDSWTQLSDDLTTNNPAKLNQKKSGGLSVDNSTAENHCTIYAIAESPRDEKVLWVGTDDGNLHLSKDGGKSFANIVGNLPGLPANTWITFIEPSPHDRNTCFVTCDGHRTGDMKTYLYKTTDLGQTWTQIAGPKVEGYALSVRQDLVKPELLFLGTEFGLYISIDNGKKWARFKNNMPKVGVRDMVIHPRDHALVMGTHGRGIIILDDLGTLRQLNKEMLAEAVYFFDREPTLLKDPGAGGGWFSGAGNFVGSNPNSSAQITYYLSRRHTFGKMYIEVYDGNDSLLKTLPAGKKTGVNIVNMPIRLSSPKAAPSNNRSALFGGAFGPNLPPGEYKVKLHKGKNVYESSFTLGYDEQSAYSLTERESQRSLAMELYQMTEDIGYMYHALGQMADQARERATTAKPSLAKKLLAFADQISQMRGSLVSMEGDFYVDEGEAIRERVSILYRKVNQYPGKPSPGQVAQAEELAKDVSVLQTQFQTYQQELASLNEMLTKKEMTAIEVDDFQTYKSP